MSGSNTYQTYCDMKSRCYNHNHKKYHRYGGRGIKVCDRWLESFENFYEDMGDKPKNCTLDRIDNNGIYSANNCRWATITQQNINREKSDMWGIRISPSNKYHLRVCREGLVRYSVHTYDISFLLHLRSKWVDEYDEDNNKWIKRTINKEYKKDMEWFILLYIVTGATNSGKTTLVDNIVTATGIKKIVTYTNRDIRDGERDNIDYNFIDTKQFDNEDFVCKRVFYTKNRREPYIYAVNKDDLLPFGDSILIIDPLGVREIKDYLGKDFVTTIYLDISEETITERAQRRGDSKEEIQRRLAADRPLFESAKYYSDICLQEDDDMLSYMYEVIKGRK